LPNKILQKQHVSIDIYFLNKLAAFAYFLFAIFGIAHCELSANNTHFSKKSKSQKDTLKFTSPEVVIIGNRITTQNTISSASTTYFSKEEISKIPALQISDIINKSPGVYIKNYGGAGGMKTANIRGTNASQSIILLDGVQLNSKQNSIYDLSLLPLSFIEEIEVTRGGSSDIFGANALGGAINLLSPKQKSNTYKINYNLGSYNEHKLSLALPTFEVNNFLFTLATSALLSKGNYKFNFDEYGVTNELQRENSQFDNFGIFFNSDYLINDVNFLNFKTINTYTDRGVPGAVVQNRIESKYATIKEFSSFNNLLYNLQINNNYFVKINLIGKYNHQKYNDDQPNAIETLKSATFLNTEFITNINNLWKLPNFNINSNIEYSYSNLIGDMLDKCVGREVSRNNFSIALYLDKIFQIKSNQNISITPSGRIDLYSNFKPSYSYAIGGLYQLSLKNKSIFEIKGRYSNNFRIPSFNELYYFNYGTSDLRPEKSQSFDLSTSFAFVDIFKFEISGFLINTRDQIISIPKNTISWAAMNLGKVLTNGIEILLSTSAFDKKLQTSFAYTLQEARDKSLESLNYNKLIIYTPQEILNATISYSPIKPIFLQLNGEYTSHRFSLPDNSYESMLSNYLILNSSIAYQFNYNKIDCRLQFEINNILNNNYHIILNYPMPGRIFRIGLKLEI